jgi:S1-C subfamily serine protease
MVALLAATLVGALAVLYYGQRVAALEATTAGARAELDAAVDRVTEAAEEAEDSIAELVRQVRESLAEGPPIDSPNDVGIYAVSAAHPGGEVRVGSGFVLLSDRDGTAVVTNYRVVATPDGFALGGADVHLPQGTFTARVHSFDRDRDLAVLVLSGGPLPVPEWRPADERVTRGDLVYLAGIAGPGTAAVGRASSRRSAPRRW